MKINSDFSKRIVIEPSTLIWVDTPVTGIQQALLEQDARSTRLIRCEPESKLDRQQLGEEIFVLDGILSNESASYGQGSYIKNLSASSLSCPTGCTLFVKLNHLDPGDRQRTVVDTRSASWFPGLVQGLSVLPLSEFGTQHTALVRWAPETQFNAHRHYGGEEIYVLEGVFEDEFGQYSAGTWIRSPHLSAHHPFSNEGCTILVKTGHLTLPESA